MTSQEVFTYLSGYYAEAMRKAYDATFGKTSKDKELQGYGAWDKTFRGYREDNLWTLFDGVMCGGKERLILSDKGGRNVYAYNGKWWVKIDTDGFMKELVKRTFKELGVGVKYMASCERIARELLASIRSSDEYLYRPDRRYIAFQNGVFDLKAKDSAGRFKQHNPKWVTDLVLDIDYKSEKECNMQFRDTCKLWDDFVSHRERGVFPNPDIARDIQLFCGALLLDRHEVKFEYMACIFGPGSNGKSVFVDAVTGVFGREFCSTFTPAQLFKEGTNSSFCVSDLEGKIVNVVGDLDNRDFSGGSLKRYISGEAIMAREPYGRKNRPVEPPLMICCANEMPEAKDDSHGHHRRILPFESTRRMWTEKDKDANLTAKLTTPEARVYIFNWIYKGYRRIMSSENNNIPWSEATVNAQERFKDNANSMRRWWKDSEWDIPESNKKGFWKPLGELYKEYKAYCEANHYTVRKNLELSAMLRSKGIKDSRRGVGMCFFIARKEFVEDSIS